jgi:hypothetical protein
MLEIVEVGLGRWDYSRRVVSDELYCVLANFLGRIAGVLPIAVALLTDNAAVEVYIYSHENEQL